MISEYDEQVLEKIKEFFSPCGFEEKLSETIACVKGFADRFSRVTGDGVKDFYATCVRESAGNGTRVKDLFLFSERYIMLVDNFEKASTPPHSFQLFSAKKRISSLKLTAENYEFDINNSSFREDSRLKLECTTHDAIHVVREAWGAHCPRLARLVKLWVIPNLA